MTNRDLIINKIKLVYSDIQYLKNSYYRTQNKLIHICENDKVHEVDLEKGDVVKIHVKYCEIMSKNKKKLMLVKAAYYGLKHSELETYNVIMEETIITYTLEVCERLIFIGTNRLYRPQSIKVTGILDNRFNKFKFYRLVDIFNDKVKEYNIQSLEGIDLEREAGKYIIKVKISEGYIDRLYELGKYSLDDLIQVIDSKRR